MPDPAPHMRAFVRLHEPLSRHSTFEIGGPALYFAEPRNLGDLREVLHQAQSRGEPWMVIGKASNILFSDEGFQGWVLTLRAFEPDQVIIEKPYVRVSAGVGLMDVSYRSADHGLSGLEFLSTIPGTVGGGLAMNAGYSRHEGRLNQMADWVDEVQVLRRDGFVARLKRNDIHFHYRASSLIDSIVLEATFKLEPRPCEEVWQEMKANLEYRRRVQPLRYPSAGSVFKNPPGISLTAGKLIALSGCLGLRAGDAQISEKHGNFIVNVGQARARDVLELIEISRARVKQTFGVELELEVKYISSEDLGVPI